MVKITKTFNILYPISIKSFPLGRLQWQDNAIRLRGRAAITSNGPHPIFAGWYRIQLTRPAQIDISFTSIQFIGGEEMISTFQEEKYSELLEGLREEARRYMLNKFLS